LGRTLALSVAAGVLGLDLAFSAAAGVVVALALVALPLGVAAADAGLLFFPETAVTGVCTCMHVIYRDDFSPT
jgi:hypothetical protein